MKNNSSLSIFKSVRFALCAGVVSAVTSFSAHADTLIDSTTNNGGFESNAGRTGSGYDSNPDVPFWMNTGGTYTDTGVDSGNGGEVAYVRADNGGAFQMTGYVIKLGDVFTLNLESEVGFIAGGDQTGSLMYSLITFAPSATGTGAALYSQATTVATNTKVTNGTTGYSAAPTITYTAQAADVGRYVGVSFDNISTNGGVYAGVDNVTLSVVPEPSTWVMLLGGMGLLALVRPIRNRHARS